MRISLFAMAALLMTGAASAAEREPRDCLNNRSIRETRLTTDQGYFARSAGELWQNKVRGCTLLGPDRSIRTLSTITRQCSGDQIVVFQNFSQQEFWTCVLGPWEPVADEAVPAPPRAGEKN